MSDMAFAQLTQTATALDYKHKLMLLTLIAQSLYNDEVGGKNDGFSGGEEERAKLDEAIAEFKRGEYEVFESFDDFKAAMTND